MTYKQAFKIWLDGANEAKETSQLLFKHKKYDFSLFFIQLYLEKLIKAIHIYRNKNEPLFSHNLRLLSQKAGIKLSKTQIDELEEISKFNITARYPEDKLKLHIKATLSFTNKWLSTANNLAIYLLSFLKT